MVQVSFQTPLFFISFSLYFQKKKEYEHSCHDPCRLFLLRHRNTIPTTTIGSHGFASALPRTSPAGTPYRATSLLTLAFSCSLHGCVFHEFWVLQIYHHLDKPMRPNLQQPHGGATQASSLNFVPRFPSTTPALMITPSGRCHHQIIPLG